MFKTFFIFAFILLLASSALAYNTAEKGVVGAEDYTAYWSAYQVVQSGGNPYDGRQILKAEQRLYPSAKDPQYFFNPPWMLPLFAPLLSLDFRMSYRAWLALNFIFLVATMLLAGKLVPVPRVSAIGVVLTGLVLPPVWYIIKVGQLTLFITAFLFLALLAYSARKDVLCGLSLALVSIKPHPVYLILTVLGFFILFEKRWRVIISLLASLTLMFLITPFRLFHEWVGMKFNMLTWVTPTVVEFARDASILLTGRDPKWVLIVIPLITSLTVLALVAQKRKNFSWAGWLVPLSALSLITSPYLQIYDFALLLPVAALWWGGGYKAFALLAAVQAAFLMDMRHTDYIVWLVWYPAAMLLVYLYEKRSSNRISAQPRPAPQGQ